MEKGDFDRVRRSTSTEANLEIDKKILNSIESYRKKSKEEISQRIEKLEKEWSIERWLELNASTIAFIGVLLGAFVSMYWLFLPAIVLPLLALHAVQGWCPPIPIMRKLNVRTRREIDWEKFALKVLRHDFDGDVSVKSSEEIFDIVKRAI